MNSIIWDWNGTLLNDLDFCISCINVLLNNRNLPLLNRNTYKEVFSFPVKDYYEAIGFNFNEEDFSVPAHEFIELYNENIKSCSLHPAANKVLQFFREKGVRQFVLSAMHRDMLIETLKHHKILDYFEGVAGLDDFYAVSKIERGLQLIDEFRIEKNTSLIIGDTIHDFEVARELGIQCILIADGHQSEQRLKSTVSRVLPNLEMLIAIPIFE
jgi:phosphoglycolate phosphatase